MLCRKRRPIGNFVRAPIAPESRLRKGLRGHATAGAGPERLGQHHGVAVIERGAAGGLGLGESQQPELPELAEDFMRRECARILPGIHLRIEFFAAEPLDGAAQLGVFVGQLHGNLGLRAGRRRR